VNHEKVGAQHMRSPLDDEKSVKIEAEVSEAEVLEKFEKRFQKSLPLECVNVLVIMDNALFEE